MTDQLLNVLKLALLALLYLFFARVLWAVWSEVRGAGTPANAPAASGPPPAARSNPAPPKRARRRDAKRPKGQVARLVIVEPKARKGVELPVDREITFGRSAGCTVSVPDDSFMSSLHARVFMREGDTFVEDLGSTNGTFLNGNRLNAEMQLHRGDRLQVGGTKLEAD